MDATKMNDIYETIGACTPFVHQSVIFHNDAAIAITSFLRSSNLSAAQALVEDLLESEPPFAFWILFRMYQVDILTRQGRHGEAWVEVEEVYRDWTAGKDIMKWDGEGHQWMEEMNEHIKRQHKGVRMYHLKDTPQSYNVEAGDEDDGKDEGDSDETAPPLAEAPLVAEEAGEPCSRELQDTHVNNIIASTYYIQSEPALSYDPDHLCAVIRSDMKDRAG